MSVRNAPTYQQSAPTRGMDNDSDEEGMEYVQEAAYENEGVGNDFGGDLSLQLQQAAQPLEYGATTDTKISSYDQYCNLFHFILNSDGPVDIDVPSVSSGRHD